MPKTELEALEPLSTLFGYTLGRGERLSLRGRLVIVLEGAAAVTSHDETPRPQDPIDAGDFVGEGCLVRASTAMTLLALTNVRLLAVPSARLDTIFHASPDYGLRIAAVSYARAIGQPAARRPLAASIAERAAKQAAARAFEPATTTDNPFLAPFPFNDEWFYSDQTTCRACETTFRYIRVRTRAIHATQRDSDLRYSYSTVNPLHYAVVVCPRCCYAAFGDEFAKLAPSEIAAITADAPGRIEQWAGREWRGERDLALVAASLELALDCYRARQDTGRRAGSVLQRLAWLARERADVAGERRYLDEAVAEFSRAYEGDRKLSPRESVTLCYLIGELSLRLGRYDDAIRWFVVLQRLDESKRHREIMRLMRERWADARAARSREREGRAA